MPERYAVTPKQENGVFLTGILLYLGGWGLWTHLSGLHIAVAFLLIHGALLSGAIVYHLTRDRPPANG